MSVRRDPETGQFVSAGQDIDWPDVERFRGHTHASIPAADLSGTVTSFALEDHSTELLDFDEELANDEVFELWYGYYGALMALHTTASAESHAHAAIQVSTDVEMVPGFETSPAHWKGSPQSEEGVFDIDSNGSRDNAGLAEFRLDAEPSFDDGTTAGGGGSGATDMDTMVVPYSSVFGAGPVFDVNDSIFVPQEVHVDNISDHLVRTTTWVNLYGVIHEL